VHLKTHLPLSFSAPKTHVSDYIKHGFLGNLGWKPYYGICVFYSRVTTNCSCT